MLFSGEGSTTSPHGHFNIALRSASLYQTNRNHSLYERGRAGQDLEEDEDRRFVVNDNFLYNIRANKNLLYHHKRSANKGSSATSSQNSHILSPVNAVPKVITKNNGGDGFSPLSSGKQGKPKKPAFRIKQVHHHPNDVSDIVL